MVKHYNADSVNKVLVEPFHNYQFIAELKNGQIIVLNQKQALQLLQNGKYVIDPKNFIGSKGTNSSFFIQYVIPEVNKLVY